MSKPELELLAELEELARRKREHRLAYYTPYAKQRQFHAMGIDKRERLFMAGNQLGKTVAGSHEVAMHLTGEYPDWWEGKRFAKPVRCWAAGVTGESTRDNPQRLLLGVPSAIGTGAIPKKALANVRWSRGAVDSADTVYVKHKSGDLSMLAFKSYERGRQKWQGESLDFIWFDEEPPADIYAEGLARVTATKGIIFITFTPLMGASEVVRRFLQEESDDRAVVQMEISEAEHIAPEERERIIAGYPAHEREARSKGIPVLGSGRIYPVAEEVITCEPFPIPGHYSRIAGIDFGWDHPTAAVWLAWDKDSDTVYVTDCYREKEQTPLIHAAAIKARGPRVPVAWPHDGLQHDKSGNVLADLYRAQGVNMLSDPARYRDQRGNAVEAGLMDTLQRMQTFRFKVFSHLKDWFEEFRLYHRKDGKPVKVGEDLMDATRYAVMMLPYAQVDRDKDSRRRKRYELPRNHNSSQWVY